MRIVRVKLEKATTELLHELCRVHKIGDFSFIEDLFALIKSQGNGLPDDARVEKLAEHYAKVRKTNSTISKSIIRKRRQILRDISSLATFVKYVQGKSRINPITFTEQLILGLKKLHVKVRQAQCITCQFFKDCDFGKQYHKNVKNINVVVDPDYQKKVHKDCPHLPEIESLNQMVIAAQTQKQLANPTGENQMLVSANTALQDDNANGYVIPDRTLMAKEVEDQCAAEAKAQAYAVERSLDDLLSDVNVDSFISSFGHGYIDDGGRGGSYDATHIEGTDVNLNNDAIDKMRVTHLVIFELSRKLEALLKSHKKGHFKPTEDMTRKVQSENIKSISDAPKVHKSQLAQDDDVFDAKLAKRQLIKKQQVAPVQKRQLLYVLIDFSASMKSTAGLSPQLGFVSRAALAGSFSIALSRRICSEQGIMFVRGFAGSPSALKDARTPEEFELVERWIADGSYNGSSTEIPKALTTAFQDIELAKDELKGAEVLLITDSGDRILPDEVSRLRKMFTKVPLSVLDCVGGDPSKLLGAARDLASLADHYYKIDPSKSGFEQMIQLIGGKKRLT